MADHNVIFCGDDNQITNSDTCTIINGRNNRISNKTNTHIIGENITASVSHAFYIGCSNGLFCDGDIQSNYSLSDSRLKKNQQKIENCVGKIKEINGVSFKWNNKQETYQGKDIGLIAQQVQKIAPEIVETRETGYLAIKYEKIIPLLIGAINEQQEKINLLEAQVDSLLGVD
jgi:hypothetical protein